MARQITVQAVLNASAGFGQLGLEVISRLLERGWDVRVKPMEILEPIPLEIMEVRSAECGVRSEWELLIAPLDRAHVPTPGVRTIYWTMWETTQLTPKQVAVLNRAEAVIAPGEWVKTVFLISGVTRPIHIVPLGIAPDIFAETPTRTTGLCVFGAGGCVSASRKRKQLERIIGAFQEAFVDLDGVELRLKLLPGESAPIPDPRIKLYSQFMDWCALQRWYSGLTAFVNVGMEGWGLMPHQAMACGRPVLAPEFGGVTEYFNGSVGYPVDYTMKKPYGTPWLGQVAVAEQASLVAQMRRVYFDRVEAAEFGREAAKRAREFTWDRTVGSVEEVIEHCASSIEH